MVYHILLVFNFSSNAATDQIIAHIFMKTFVNVRILSKSNTVIFRTIHAIVGPAQRNEGLQEEVVLYMIHLTCGQLKIIVIVLLTL